MTGPSGCTDITQTSAIGRADVVLTPNTYAAPSLYVLVDPARVELASADLKKQLSFHERFPSHFR